MRWSDGIGVTVNVSSHFIWGELVRLNGGVDCRELFEYVLFGVRLQMNNLIATGESLWYSVRIKVEQIQSYVSNLMQKLMRME